MTGKVELGALRVCQCVDGRTALRPEKEAVEEAFTKHPVTKVVLLNAALMFPDTIAFARRASFEELKEVVEIARRHGIPIESYIGHPATAELLSKLLGVEVPVNRAMYQPNAADLVYVVRLKKRLATPQEVVELTPEDLEVIQVHYVPL